MPKENPRTTFLCKQCGGETPKWLGRCPDCGEWNTLREVRQDSSPRRRAGRGLISQPQELATLVTTQGQRIPLPMPETNQVLGGGIVRGATVLMAGDPGIGKSTLMLQIAALLAARGQRALYVSGEESSKQVHLRAQRLCIDGQGLYFLPETNIEAILEHMEVLAPEFAIIDSIQTMYTDAALSSAGSLAQIRECTSRLIEWAKRSDTPIFIAGHVTKDGAVAGPRVLEHMVDVVLYLDGGSMGEHRILRSVKNRFGSTNDIALFQMTPQGLQEVADPSAAFISQRQDGAVGSAVIVTLEGSRPLMAEVQALTSRSVFTPPRRTTNGIQFNRLILVTAVLGRRAAAPLDGQDIIVNVTGGLQISEPSADLGIAVAITSSLRDVPIDSGSVFLGEVDLTGELRPVSHLDRRLSEAAKLGFRKVFLPKAQAGREDSANGLEIVGVSTLMEALKHALLRTSTNA